MFKCDYCDKEVKSKSGLARHMNSCKGKIVDEGKVNDENVVVLEVMGGESTYYEGHPRRLIKLKGLLSRTEEGKERRKIYAMIMELINGSK